MASLDDYLAFQRRREADKAVAANLGRLLSSHAARQQPQLEQQIMRVLYGSPVQKGSPANVAETAQLLERVLSDPAANIRSLDAFNAAPAARPSAGPTIGTGKPGASPEDAISRALAAGTLGAATSANPAGVAKLAAQGLKGAGLGGSLLGAATGAALNPDNPLPHALDWGAMALSPVGYAALSPGEAQAGPLSKYLQQLIELTKSRYGAGTPMERAEALLQEVDRQAPASFKAYRSDQLLSHIADAAQPGAQDRMMLATPAQFQRLAMPRPLSEKSDAQVASLAAMLKNRTSTPDAYGEDYYAKRYPRFEGFGDVPMLRYGDVDNLPFARVLGHEGRHRLAAAGEVLGDYEPLAIRAFGYDPAELQAATNLAQVLPESPSKRLSKMYMGSAGQDSANQDFLKLFMEPQLQPLDNFKAGGPVKLAGGGSVAEQVTKWLARKNIPETKQGFLKALTGSPTEKEFISSNFPVSNLQAPFGLRYETALPKYDEGIAHYDLAGGKALGDIIRNIPNNVLDHLDAIKYGRADYLPENVRKLLLGGNEAIFGTGQVRVSPFGLLDPASVKVKDYDVFMNAMKTPAVPTETSGALFYPNEGEGAIGADLSGLPPLTRYNAKTILSDPDLREAYNVSAAVPESGSFYKNAFLLKKKGGSVKLAGGGSVLGQLKKLLAPALTPSYVVKPEGGQWLTGSVEEALKGLKKAPLGHTGEGFTPWKGDEYGIGPGAMYHEPSGEILTAKEYAPVARAAALNSWISGPLTKYVKQRMATPSDEIRQLAEHGVLHSPDIEQWSQSFTHPTGMSYEKLAQNPMAKAWENAADNMLRERTAEALIKEQSVPGVDPWVTKLDPKTAIYSFKDRTVPRNLGFSHLTDELANALNPASGLPPALQLNPANLNRLSVKDAVQRVAAINKWRAEQQAAANAELANQASVVREYPHSEATPNPKGLRWVELKKGELPEGWKQVETSILPKGFMSPEGTLTHIDPTEKALQDQLRYEGDTMGHCVGGYCEDVLSGQSRIFSLRDAKGEPHVTVEVAPYQGQLAKDDNGEWTTEGLHPAIVQIKGKQNKAPNPEYLPFVQDFVKNSPLGQPWSDVGDLQNAGLIDLANRPKAAEQLGRFATDADLTKFLDQFPDQLAKPSYASGGQVLPADDSALLRSFFQ